MIKWWAYLALTMLIPWSNLLEGYHLYLSLHPPSLLPCLHPWGYMHQPPSEQISIRWPVSKIIPKNFSLPFDIFPKLLLMYPHKLKVCCKCLAWRPWICCESHSLFISFLISSIANLLVREILVLSHILLGQRNTNVSRAWPISHRTKDVPGTQ